MAEAKKTKKSSSYKCSDIRPERCHKYKTHCVQDSPGEFIGEKIDEKTGETLYVYKNKRGTLSSLPYSRLNPCRKIVRGLELDEEFQQSIDQNDLLKAMKEEKSKYKCGDIKEESCYKVGKFCYLDRSIPSNYKYMGTFENQHVNQHVFQDPEGGRREFPKNIFTINGCRKIPGGPELDAEFDRLIGPSDMIENKPKGRLIKPASSYSRPTEPANLDGDWSEVQVPSSANLVVSDLPKSNSGVAKTEQVMEQVMDANVSKGKISRQKSVEVLASPAAQHYVDLRQHLTQDEVRKLDSDMLAVHSGVETILGQHLSTKDEKTALQALFDQYDLCKYVRTADKVKLTIPELTAILTSFGEVDKRVRQATTRSTIC